MQTTAALVIMMLALAAFITLVVRRGRSTAGDDRAQLRGFVYVGAGAAAVVVICVIIVQLARPGTDRAGTLAVLGFFGLCLYLMIAFVLHWWPRRGPRRNPEEN